MTGVKGCSTIRLCQVSGRGSWKIAAEALLGEVCCLAEKRGRLAVVGTTVKAWAGNRSFHPKDEDEPPKGGQESARSGG